MLSYYCKIMGQKEEKKTTKLITPMQKGFRMIKMNNVGEEI